MSSNLIPGQIYRIIPLNGLAHSIADMFDLDYVMMLKTEEIDDWCQYEKAISIEVLNKFGTVKTVYDHEFDFVLISKG